MYYQVPDIHTDVNIGAERSMSMAKKKIADKNEILEYLTGVMRSEELGEKDRIAAAIKLGRYLGLDGKDADADDSPKVVIYDGGT